MNVDSRGSRSGASDDPTGGRDSSSNSSDDSSSGGGGGGGDGSGGSTSPGYRPDDSSKSSDDSSSTNSGGNSNSSRYSRNLKTRSWKRKNVIGRRHDSTLVVEQDGDSHLHGHGDVALVADATAAVGSGIHLKNSTKQGVSSSSLTLVAAVAGKREYYNMEHAGAGTRGFTLQYPEDQSMSTTTRYFQAATTTTSGQGSDKLPGTTFWSGTSGTTDPYLDLFQAVQPFFQRTRQPEAFAAASLTSTVVQDQQSRATKVRSSASDPCQAPCRRPDHHSHRHGPSDVANRNRANTGSNGNFSSSSRSSNYRASTSSRSTNGSHCWQSRPGSVRARNGTSTTTESDSDATTSRDDNTWDDGHNTWDDGQAYRYTTPTSSSTENDSWSDSQNGEAEDETEHNDGMFLNESREGVMVHVDNSRLRQLAVPRERLASAATRNVARTRHSCTAALSDKKRKRSKGEACDASSSRSSCRHGLASNDERCIMPRASSNVTSKSCKPKPPLQQQRQQQPDEMIRPGLPTTIDQVVVVSKIPRVIVQSYPPFLVVHTNAAYGYLTGMDSHLVVGKPVSDLLSLSCRENTPAPLLLQRPLEWHSSSWIEDVTLDRVIAESGFGNELDIFVVANRLQSTTRPLMHDHSGDKSWSEEVAESRGLSKAGRQHFARIPCRMSIAPIVSSDLAVASSGLVVVADPSQQSTTAVGPRQNRHLTRTSHVDRDCHIGSNRHHTLATRPPICSKHRPEPRTGCSYLPRRTTHFVLQLRQIWTDKACSPLNAFGDESTPICDNDGRNTSACSSPSKHSSVVATSAARHCMRQPLPNEKSLEDMNGRLGEDSSAAASDSDSIVATVG